MGKNRPWKPKNPLEAIYRSESIGLATPLAKGAIFIILSAWYEAGCPELGENPDFCGISGLKAVHWLRHEKSIMRVLHEAMPRMNEIYQKDMNRMNKQRANMQRALEVSHRNHAMRLANKTLLSDKGMHNGVNPLPAPHLPYNAGFSDPQAVRAARKSNAESTGKLLTDKPKPTIS